MGVVKNRSTGEFVLLNSQHIFGRHPDLVQTTVEGTEVSRSHATLRWKSHKWVLQDHSLNGSLVNQNLVNRSSTDLKSGDLIKFGQMNRAEWELVDDGPPVSYLKQLGEPPAVLALASRTGIDMPNHPDISFYIDANFCWQAEMAGMVVELKNGARLKLDGKDWKFVENLSFESTLNLGVSVNGAVFRLLLSPDEERITAEIDGGDWKMNMGDRVHNYLILMLARRRFEDHQAGLHARDQGWTDMETLTKDMGREFQKEVDEYQVNLHIYRIRKQLLGLKPYGYMFT
ncbi:MAG: FHA domain-containing protein, partial [Bacteroidota bacterium]